MTKNHIFFTFVCLVIMHLFSCCLFQPGEQSKIKDSELFTDFAPLEWNDNFIFSFTQYPPRICVWNEANVSLVRQYDFFVADSVDALFEKGGKYLYFYDMTVIDKTIWFLAVGFQNSLVQLNVESGKINFIELDGSYEYLAYIPEANGGNGALLIAPFAQYMHEVKLQLFDLSGNILHTYTMAPTDIHLLTVNGQYKDGDYYFLASGHKDMNAQTPPDGTYKIIRLDLGSNGYEITPLASQSVLGENFLKTHAPSFPTDSYLTSFSIKPGFSENGKYLLSVDFVNSGAEGRFLFESPDLSQKAFSYTGASVLCPEDVSDGVFPRRYFQTKNGYAMIGNNGGDLYAVFFHNEKKEVVFIPNSETAFMHRTRNTIWCSKNPYSQSNGISGDWTFEGDGIYKVDLENQRVWLYNADGTTKELNAR